MNALDKPLKERFLSLLPGERESIDVFAFSQSLLERGGDVERRFSLICLDNSFELILRAYLQKRGVKTIRWRKADKVVDLAVAQLRINDLLSYSERAGLKIESDEKIALLSMHEKRNALYHGKTIMLPAKRDIEAWSRVVANLILRVTGIDPFEYFRTKEYERIAILPEDLEYVSNLERRFKTVPPYISKFTWWSEVQRDIIERGEKWDLYVHYRPRWPFFIPTLVLIKCNQYNKPISRSYVEDLESKAHFLKNEKKAWRVWLGIVSSLGFEKDAIIRAEDHEGKALGLVLINPRKKTFHSSLKGQCKKAFRWLILWG